MRIEGFARSFGPGLVWAAAAIGISHLVQSTRAGGMAGFGLCGVILLALVLKYPLFEFGPRYAAATGESLVEGYRRIGRWAVWLCFGLTLVMAAIQQAALLLFSSVLISFVFLLEISTTWLAAGIYAACALLLYIGRYRAFDLTIKVVVVVLAISTVAAAMIAFPRVDFSTFALWPEIGGEGAVPLAFILALVGFMPSPIDASVMSSLWSIAKSETTGQKLEPSAARLDFFIGYCGAGLLAFAFVMLGAEVIHDADRKFSAQGAVFSCQLVDLYVSTLGEWTRPIVSAAVLTAILSTTLVVIDGFPRVADRCLMNLRRMPSVATANRHGAGNTYWIALLIFGGIALIILQSFKGSLTGMLDFATISTFIPTPILGLLNLRAITSAEVPRSQRPGRGMVGLAYAGLALMIGTTIVFLGSRVI